MNKPIRILVNGAFGKMGQLACETLSKHPHFQLIAQLGRDNDLCAEIEKSTPDIVLDLTRADCIWHNCQTYTKYPIHFVIGTSGLNQKQIEWLTKTCELNQQGAMIVPNFSIGAVLTMQFAQYAAKWFDGVDIIEMHHHQKLDSPSGTAIRTAELIHQSKPNWPKINDTPQPGRETFVHHIPIHSVRMPGVLAYQQILFGQLGETIQLSHQIIDRTSYMPGIILACQQVIKRQQLVIGLEECLFEKEHHG